MNKPVLMTRKNKLFSKMGMYFSIMNLILCVGVIAPVHSYAMLASSSFGESPNDCKIATAFNNDVVNVINTSAMDESMHCIGSLQTSLNMDGYGVIVPSTVVITGDISNAIIKINGVIRDTVFCSDIGPGLTVEVYDTITTQSCWSTVYVEDKLPPTIECDTAFFSCTQSPFDPDLITMVDTAYDNCGAPGLTFNDGPYTASDCIDMDTGPYTGQFIRTWTAIDASGRSAQCDQVVVFEALPLDSVDCPVRDTMYCPTYSLDPDITGRPNYNGEPLSMQCGIVAWHEDSPRGYLCAGSFSIQRTWTIMNWCTEEMRICNQKIMVLDTAGPVIDCPSDFTIYTNEDDCMRDYTLPELTAYDSCSINVKSQFVLYNGMNYIAGDEITLDTGMHVLTYTVRDSCDNASICSFKVTVEDNTDPEISCTPEMVILGNGGTGLLQLPGSFVTAFDNCGEVEVLMRRIVDRCNRPQDLIYGTEVMFCCEDVGEVVMVQYLATDGSGNTNSDMCAITVKDNTPPIIGACPMDLIIGTDLDICGATIMIPIVDATDNCGVIVTNNAPATFPLGMTVVTYTATDLSDNTATCTWKVTVEDITDPEITCPADVTIQCTDDSDPSFTGEATATDNCGMPIVTNRDMPMSGICIGMNSILRTWIAIDGSGNGDSCTQMITIVDTIAPMFTFCPADVTIECGDSVDPADTGGEATAFDNCDGDVITFSDNTVVGTCPQMMILTRTWFAEDDCGNIDSCHQIISIDDTMAPTISVPANVTIACGESTDSANTGTATSMDACNGTTVNMSDASAVGSCPQEMIITRTWTATDGCLNSTQDVQLITVVDSVAPVISCPADLTIDCDESLPTTPATATDACAPDMDVVITSMIIPNGEQDGVLRRWYATDPCGNADSCDQVIMMMDMTPPVVNCPDNISVDNDPGLCGAMVDVMITDTTDNCGIITVTNSFNMTDDPSGFYPVGTTDVTVIVTDGGGLMDTCMFSVIVTDTMPPAIICPSDISIAANPEPNMCFAMVTIPLPDTSDNCGITNIGHNSTVSSGGIDASGIYPVGSTDVVWTVTDNNGLMSTCMTTVNVIDSTAPTIECPDTTFAFAQEIFGCGADVDPVLFPTLMDNCGVTSLTNSIDGTSDPSGMFNVGSTTFVWTATDAAGNTATCSAVVTVLDTISPVIACPMDITQSTDPGMCSAIVTIPLPDTSDNCQVMSVTHVSTASVGGIDASGTYPFGITTVTYTITDIYGNSATCSFDVTIEDMGAPMITCPMDMTVDCDFVPSDLDGFPMATAMGSCTMESIPVAVLDTFNLDETCNVGTIFRTFSAVAQGQSVMCVQTITVENEGVKFDDGNIACPDNLTVDACDMDLSPMALISMPVLDTTMLSCFDLYVSHEDGMIVNPDFCRTIERTWTIVDSCQVKVNPNTGTFTCVQIIGINDNMAPDFMPMPEDTIMAFLTQDSCDIFVDVPVPTAEDCSDPVIITHSSMFADNPGTNASGVYPLGPTSVIFTASDMCGNMVFDTIVVQVKDTIFPSIDCFKVEYDIEPDGEVDAIASNHVIVGETCGENYFISWTIFDPLDTVLVFDCTVDGLVISETVYIFDELGNFDSCTALIEIRESDLFCNDMPLTIGGSAKTQYGGDLPYAMVNMMNLNMDGAMTDENGHYQFDDLESNKMYQFGPERDGDFTNGLNTLDMIGLVRHVLGIDPLENPYTQIAADVDGNRNVNMLDVLKMQQVILYLMNEIPENTSWRFVDRAYAFEDPLNALGENFAETMTYDPLMEDQMNSDFVAVKVGDINGTATPGLDPIDLRGSNPSMELTYEQDSDGDLIFRSDRDLYVDGYQMSIQLSDGAQEKYEVINDDQNRYVSHRWIDAQTLGLTVVHATEVEVDQDDVLLELRLKTGQSMNSKTQVVLDDLIAPEIYSGSDIYNIQLVSKKIGEGTFELFQNQPNPFSTTTEIKFIAPKDGEVTLTLFDINGSEIGTINYDALSGQNEIIIDSKILGSGGVYYYQLSTDGFRAVKKLIYTP